MGKRAIRIFGAYVAGLVILAVGTIVGNRTDSLPFAVWSAIALMPIAFGWISQKLFLLTALETALIAPFIPGVPLLLMQRAQPHHGGFNIPIIVGWFLFSLLGFRLATRFKE